MSASERSILSLTPEADISFRTALNDCLIVILLVIMPKNKIYTRKSFSSSCCSEECAGFRLSNGFEYRHCHWSGFSDFSGQLYVTTLIYYIGGSN